MTQCLYELGTEMLDLANHGEHSQAAEVSHININSRSTSYLASRRQWGKDEDRLEERPLVKLWALIAIRGENKMSLQSNIGCAAAAILASTLGFASLIHAAPFAGEVVPEFGTSG